MRYAALLLHSVCMSDFFTEQALTKSLVVAVAAQDKSISAKSPTLH